MTNGHFATMSFSSDPKRHSLHVLRIQWLAGLVMAHANTIQMTAAFMWHVLSWRLNFWSTRNRKETIWWPRDLGDFPGSRTATGGASVANAGTKSFRLTCEAKSARELCQKLSWQRLIENQLKWSVAVWKHSRNSRSMNKIYSPLTRILNKHWNSEAFLFWSSKNISEVFNLQVVRLKAEVFSSS